VAVVVTAVVAAAAATSVVECHTVAFLAAEWDRAAFTVAVWARVSIGAECCALAVATSLAVTSTAGILVVVISMVPTWLAVTSMAAI